MIDITERNRVEEVLRQSEDRFRRLVELMPVAVYVCDTAGRIQSYNNRAVELWGREPKSGDTAQCYCGSLRLYSPDGKFVPHEESKMTEVLRTGIEARDLEVVIERPDGSSITVLVNIVPLRNGNGELIGAMNCFQDITERKQAQKELQHSFGQLRALAGRLQIARRGREEGGPGNSRSVGAEFDSHRDQFEFIHRGAGARKETRVCGTFQTDRPDDRVRTQNINRAQAANPGRPGPDSGH